ncbi:MAG: hypothetical protein IT430_01790 [Phycisphaerales bacterium]|nr:hypothetical protein [Phycisphaerales bacterium]
MKAIDVRRAGFALGSACGLFYIGCVFVMLTSPHDAVVRFFNSILHGWNVEPIMRWDMPWWEAAIGVVEITILGWLFGAMVAALYNISVRLWR